MFPLKSISSKLQEIIWPIEKEELKLFLPMALMMLCILFNFGALRSVKDGLVIPSIGAEVISFLKLWLVLPSSIIFTIIYVRLSNQISFEYIFYIIISSFLLFFLIFAYIIYPNQEYYHPTNEQVEHLIYLYPNFRWFIKIIGKWSYAIMYICSELWSAVIINLMFWQFANNIFDTNKAKRFYPILGMVGNIGLVLAGNLLVICSDLASVNPKLLLIPNMQHQSEMMLKPIIAIIVLAGVVSMCLFRLINYIILNDAILKYDFNTAKIQAKTSLSLIESVRMVMKSKYMGHIALLIICYGLLINIVEGPWKAKVRELNPNTLDYINFMGRFNIWMGITCVTFMIVGSNVIRKFTWLISALLTPLMFSITGLSFFIFVIFSEDIDFGIKDFNPIYAAVIIGGIQNVLSKSTKYSLFDSTKEMAYIPLPLELRTKGKAAVEVIGTKFGKSLGAFIQSFIFIIMPTATFDSIVSYLLIIFIIIVFLWLWNIVHLNKEYIKLCH
ncbi:Npt1/Npt2 family nucleotide transporter [Candidatus Tisiphia endosymbiont of Nemotelus uliginosus]|uniref:Npt1/Npt2 family nucleotide transporter n=1 Tax=Candidatus Tisiphia endosymbiont of Nemotelus uliginosus TaxID=3077926 RepID=UPI0035C8EAE0